MADKVCAYATVFLGAFMLLCYAGAAIRNALQGKKILDGKVIGIDHDSRSLIIRYKIGKELYQDIAYRTASCFLSGNIPKIGLKVTVTVYKEDLYRPISVLMHKNYARGAKPGYLNSSKLLELIRLIRLSSFLIICGILTLIGVF